MSETKEEREARWAKEEAERKVWEVEARDLQRREFEDRHAAHLQQMAWYEREQPNVFAHRKAVEEINAAQAKATERIADALEALAGKGGKS